MRRVGSGGDRLPIEARMKLPPSSLPLWGASPSPTYAPLSEDREADVVIVGAGIAGLTTALLVARAGRSVAVLEALHVGAGTTGRTTAKASTLQGTKYQRITEHHGSEAAKQYATAQVDALAWMSDHVASSSIACDWEVRPAINYAVTADGQATVEAELEAAAAAGLPVERMVGDLPFDTTAAIGIAGQAQFDPQAYLDAIAAQVAAEPSAQIYESSRVTSISGLRRHTVTTDGGRIRCGAVVVATLLPIVDRGLFFARAEPKSSYLIALRANGPLPHGMYLSADPDSRSLRTARGPDGDLLLVGGQGHPTGKGAPTLARYQELANWAAVRMPVDSVVARWSAHDIVPADHLPWVGSSSPATPNVLTASGFDKWGMTMGTAAALILADRLMADRDARTAPWSGLFNPARLSPRGVIDTARISGKVGTQLVSDWAHPEAAPGPDGRGRRRRRGLVPVGDPGPPSSTEVAVVCTHLGGICSWNDGDATWDCPLHGSRFSSQGTVVAAPATRPLRSRGHANVSAPAADAARPPAPRPPTAATSSGYLVEGREVLLDRMAELGLTPGHAQVIADHVTYRSDDPDPAPEGHVFTVDGFVRGDGVDAVIGAIDGERARPDGGTFHITLSVAPGHLPVESNDAVKQGPIEPVAPFDVAVRPF